MKPWPHTQNMHCAFTKWGYTTFLSMQNFGIINYNKLLNKIFSDTYCIIDWNVLYWRKQFIWYFFITPSPPNVGVFPNKLCLWGGRRRAWCQHWIKTPPFSGSLWIQRDPSEYKMLATLSDSLIISWEEK